MHRVIVCPIAVVATVIHNVTMLPMKLAVHRDILMVPIVGQISLLVIILFVSIKTGLVMEVGLFDLSDGYLGNIFSYLDNDCRDNR